jgi:hypothetical protein
MSKTTWYVAVNTMAATPGLTVGRVISSHRSMEAAEAACRRAQPREPGHYLPVAVLPLPRRYEPGEYVNE